MTNLDLLFETQTDGRSSVPLLRWVSHAQEPAGVGVSSSTQRRTLRLAPQYAQARVEVAGDFTAWVPIEMPCGEDGCFCLVVEMARNARWRYRFRVDDASWINDPDADDYESVPGRGVASLLYT